jgi:hypothetical protein
MDDITRWTLREEGRAELVYYDIRCPKCGVYTRDVNPKADLRCCGGEQDRIKGAGCCCDCLSEITDVTTPTPCQDCGAQMRGSSYKFCLPCGYKSLKCACCGTAFFKNQATHLAWHWKSDVSLCPMCNPSLWADSPQDGSWGPFRTY